MEWHFRNDQPIYTQLTRQITLAILSGSIPSGGRLPTVRELAADASPSLTLICPDSDGIPLLLSQLQRQLRDALGVFINIEPLEPSELDSRIASRDYDLALCPAKEDLARSRTREYLESMAQLGYDRQQVKALLEEWKEE